jgi:hypothetical protein
MQDVTVEVAETEQDARPQWVGGRYPPGYSGNPSGSKIPKRQRELIAAMSPEFGGDAMSSVDKAELAAACRLMARAEREKNAPAALTSEARRILQGLRRRMKPAAAPSWQECFARKAAVPSPTEPLAPLPAPAAPVEAQQSLSERFRR